MEGIDYEDWYPEVPPVMDTKQLAELLHTDEQIIRAWVREGVLPAHRNPGGRKFTFLRHEIFDWLITNRYDPTTDGAKQATFLQGASPLRDIEPHRNAGSRTLLRESVGFGRHDSALAGRGHLSSR